MKHNIGYQFSEECAKEFLIGKKLTATMDNNSFSGKVISITTRNSAQGEEIRAQTDTELSILLNNRNFDYTVEY